MIKIKAEAEAGIDTIMEAEVVGGEIILSPKQLEDFVDYLIREKEELVVFALRRASILRMMEI